MSKNAYLRRRSLAAAVSAVVVVAMSLDAAWGSSAEVALEGLQVVPGTLFGAADDGRFALLDPVDLAVEIWSTAGRKLHAQRVERPSPEARPTGVALLGERVLVAFARDDQPAHTCVLLTIDDSTPPATFIGGEVPSRLYAGPDGWIFEQLAPGDEPTIERFGADGTYLGRLDPPGDPVARAREVYGDPSYAFLRLVAAAGDLWAVPSFNYELWRLRGASKWATIPQPPCLAVSASYVEGEAARKRMLERAETMPEPEAQRLHDRVAWTREIGLNVKSYATAVRGAVGHGEHLLVLTEPHPERESGACRLDLWSVRDRRVVGVREVAGSCPALVALGKEGLWLARGGRLTRVAPPVPSRNPCPPGGP